MGPFSDVREAPGGIKFGLLNNSEEYTLTAGGQQVNWIL